MKPKAAAQRRQHFFSSASDVMNAYFPVATRFCASEPADVVAAANRMVTALLATACKSQAGARLRRGRPQRQATAGA